jgi:hypothetical protein
MSAIDIGLALSVETEGAMQINYFPFYPVALARKHHKTGGGDIAQRGKLMCWPTALNG